jgi:hypothetical protein
LLIPKKKKKKMMMMQSKKLFIIRRPLRPSALVDLSSREPVFSAVRIESAALDTHAFSQHL